MIEVLVAQRKGIRAHERKIRKGLISFIVYFSFLPSLQCKAPMEKNERDDRYLQQFLLTTHMRLIPFASSPDGYGICWLFSRIHPI